MSTDKIKTGRNFDHLYFLFFEFAYGELHTEQRMGVKRLSADRDSSQLTYLTLTRREQWQSNGQLQKSGFLSTVHPFPNLESADQQHRSKIMSALKPLLAHVLHATS